jgi:hypothetical protein
VSIKTTVVLACILLALGAYVYFSPGEKPLDGTELGPEVWSIDENDIDRIQITLQQTVSSHGKVAFARQSDGRWRFDDPGRAEVDSRRWGGIPLLVSGPASKRVIAEKADSLADYGLDNPQMQILLDVRGRGTLEVMVGDKTPDQGNTYVKIREWDRVYTVDITWAEVLTRLVTEPPVLVIPPTPAESSSH